MPAERLLNSTIDSALIKTNSFHRDRGGSKSMEVIETIVTENVEVEENETVVSNLDADKTKAG